MSGENSFNLTIRLFGMGGRPAPEDDVLGVVIAVALLAIPIVYAILQVRTRWRGRWRIAAGAPILLFAGRLAALPFEADREGRLIERLPLEGVIACALASLLWLLIVYRRQRHYRAEVLDGGYLPHRRHDP
jgi:hypothetical protein